VALVLPAATGGEPVVHVLVLSHDVLAHGAAQYLNGGFDGSLRPSTVMLPWIGGPNPRAS
jgi:hypothetical protein